jgi:hypothetical protein
MAFVFYIGPKNSYGQKKQNPTFWLKLFLLTKKDKTGSTLSWKSEATNKVRTINLVPNDSRIWMRFVMSFWINGFGFLTLLHALPIQIASQSSMLGIVFRAVGMIFLVDMDDVKGQAMTVVENDDTPPLPPPPPPPSVVVKVQEKEEKEEKENVKDDEQTVTPKTMSSSSSSPNGGGLLDDQYDRTSNVFFRKIDVELANGGGIGGGAIGGGIGGGTGGEGGGPEDALAIEQQQILEEAMIDGLGGGGGGPEDTFEIEKQRIIEEAMIDVRRKIEDLVRHGGGGSGSGGSGSGGEGPVITTTTTTTTTSSNVGGSGGGATRRSTRRRSSSTPLRPALSHVLLQSVHHMNPKTTTQPTKKTAVARNV